MSQNINHSLDGRMICTHTHCSSQYKSAVAVKCGVQECGKSTVVASYKITWNEGEGRAQFAMFVKTCNAVTPVRIHNLIVFSRRR